MKFFAKNFDSKLLMLGVMYFPDRKPKIRFSRSKNIKWTFNFWIGRWIFVVRLGPSTFFVPIVFPRTFFIETVNEYSAGRHYYFRGR